MSLGKAIRHARIDKGWKQKDLWQAAQVSQKYLSGVENDKIDPKFSVVQRLAKALGVTVGQLAEDDTDATT